MTYISAILLTCILAAAEKNFKIFAYLLIFCNHITGFASLVCVGMLLGTISSFSLSFSVLG